MKTGLYKNYFSPKMEVNSQNYYAHIYVLVKHARIRNSLK